MLHERGRTPLNPAMDPTPATTTPPSHTTAVSHRTPNLVGCNTVHLIGEYYTTLPAQHSSTSGAFANSAFSTGRVCFRCSGAAVPWMVLSSRFVLVSTVRVIVLICTVHKSNVKPTIPAILLLVSLNSS